MVNPEKQRNFAQIRKDRIEQERKDNPYYGMGLPGSTKKRKTGIERTLDRIQKYKGD